MHANCNWWEEAFVGNNKYVDTILETFQQFCNNLPSIFKNNILIWWNSRYYFCKPSISKWLLSNKCTQYTISFVFYRETILCRIKHGGIKLVEIDFGIITYIKIQSVPTKYYPRNFWHIFHRNIYYSICSLEEKFREWRGPNFDIHGLVLF